MVPLRTSESDAFPVAVRVGHDNARAIGTDGEAGHAQRCPVCSGMGQNRRCRDRLSTAGLPSTAEEPLPCPSRPEVAESELETGGCESAPNRDLIQNRSMPW